MLRPMGSSEMALQDSYRFRFALEDASERLGLLGLITADAAKRRDNPSFSGRNGRTDIFGLMVREKDLETNFDKLMQRRQTLQGLSNRRAYTQNQAELSEVTKLLRDSTAVIKQSLRDNLKNIKGNIEKIQRDRSELQDLMTGTARELAVTRTFQTLAQQVEQRAVEARALSDAQRAHEQLLQQLQRVASQREAELHKHEKDLDERGARIQQLTAELKRLRQVTEVTLQHDRATAEAAAETQRRLWSRRLEELKKKTEEAEADRAVDDSVNQHSMAFLNKHLEAVEAEEEAWKERSSKDIAAKTAAMETLVAQRDAVKAELDQLSAEWAKDKARRQAAVEEAKRRIDDEARAEVELRRMVIAANLIRFHWHIYAKKLHAKRAKKKKRSSAKGDKKSKKKP